MPGSAPAMRTRSARDARSRLKIVPPADESECADVAFSVRGFDGLDAEIDGNPLAENASAPAELERVIACRDHGDGVADVPEVVAIEPRAPRGCRPQRAVGF